MFLRRNTFVLVFFLCSLVFWCRSTSAGSSFLSSSHKPQNKEKSSRIGRQVLEDPDQDESITISLPFDLGITMKGDELEEEFGLMLQEIIQRLLGNAETETPS